MKSLEHYLLLPYTMLAVPDECVDGSRCYIARVQELPGCESHGETADEALQNLHEAKELYLRTMLEDGIEPPVPAQSSTGGTAIVATWRVEPVGEAAPQEAPAWPQFNGSSGVLVG